jgi:RNA polymerase sigma-70 factor (ECF subfamily)
MEPDEEVEIITRVLKGESHAYGRIVNAYKKPIFNLAYRMTGSYDDANDLAQETFLKAYSNLNLFDRKKRFFTWLYTISLNLIRNYLRDNRGVTLQEYLESALPYDPLQGDPSDPEGVMIREQERQRLEMFLQTLSTDLREAVVLRFYQELSLETMAEVLKISLSAVKMRVYRGLKALREAFGDSPR